MNELKEHQFCESDEFFREYHGPLSNEMRPYYLKSEADRVIEEKDKELRHANYRRCVAMADFCEDKLGTVVKPGWWDKWRKRWLELADKFKPDNSTAQ